MSDWTIKMPLPETSEHLVLDLSRDDIFCGMRVINDDKDTPGLICSTIEEAVEFALPSISLWEKFSLVADLAASIADSLKAKAL